jgi:glycosyltransferase involved in cell wall biosynthesis
MGQPDNNVGVSFRYSGMTHPLPRICLVGLGSLPVLAREYSRHYAGGAELQQALLAKALSRAGFPVSLIVADYGQSDGAVWDGIKTYKAYRQEEGIPVVRFLHPRWTGLWAAMKRADADVYYTMCAGAQVGEMALFTRRYGRRLVFAAASDADCDPRALLIRYWRDRQLYRFGLTRADAVLSQSAAQQRSLARNFGVQSYIVEALAEPAERVPDFAARDIDVLWVANVRSLKRPDRLLEIARRLPDLRFHMVGGPYAGERELFDSIRSQAARLPNVTFHGFVPYRDARVFYERARVLVNTSEVEGFPNTYIQAWMHGAPVVTFIDPDSVIGREGLGHAAGSVDEMCASVRAVLADEAQWSRLSERCRRHADRRFDPSRILIPYLEALRGVSAPACAVS